MNATTYAKKFRRIGIICAVSGAVTGACLVYLKIFNSPEFSVFIGVGLSLIPLAVFTMNNKPICQKCSGRMKVSKGFPNIEYTCRNCGFTEDTELSSD